MWIKNRQKIDWNRMAEDTNKLIPRILELIAKEMKAEDGREMSCAGYIVKEPVFSNFPPRLIVDTKLDFKEESSCKPYDLERMMRKVAKALDSEDGGIELLEVPYYPMNQSLERDKVYGPNPEKPPSISFVFSLKRGNYIIG